MELEKEDLDTRLKFFTDNQKMLDEETETIKKKNKEIQELESRVKALNPNAQKVIEE